MKLQNDSMEYGLIGGKLAHSYSKEIHEAIADYRYELRELSSDALRSFLRARAFRALNVTIPYKETVIRELDHISSRASAIGAVNTIVNREGKLFGYNTDFSGMLSLIGHAGIELSGKKVMILGTGGTSKTAQAVSKELGAREIVIVSRRSVSGAITYEEAIESHQNTEIMINATPAGMAPNESNQPIDLTYFPYLSGVIDVIYHPIRTNLVLQAESLGIPAAGGLVMLAAQAAEAAALFTSLESEEEDPAARKEVLRMTEIAFRRVLREKRNLVLIGMPTAGKSAAAKWLSEITGKRFANTDDMVEERIGEPVPDFIRREGEAPFRAFEKEAVQQISRESGLVIATGGGTVLDPENVRALKRNGLLIFLKRPLEALQPAKDRPLSDTPEKLAEMYERRRPVYEAAADLTIDANGDPKEDALRILKRLG